ncbi:MAG: adenylate/guanylate cyclase domain-containing protein [Chloroflexota bacterium]
MNIPRYPEERRLATILFADVHGFTALAEQLDFEIVSDLIKSIWKRLDAVIEAHGGYIDKHMGDGVMAVWGAPLAGDQDAEQAVHAALAMQTALRGLVVDAVVPGVTQLRLRVGINSGPVFAGYLGNRDEYTVIGDAVNVASRFEQMAEPGTVVIGENTFRLVRGAFRVRRLTPFALKGKTEPVEAFTVEGAVPAGGRYRTGDGLATQMVGRSSELEQLGQIYQQFQASQSPVMVMVTGAAGVGKSRLLMEFTNRLQLDKVTTLIGSARALAQAERVPFYLWKNLWNNWFGITNEDSAESLREKFTREISRLWGKQLSLSSPLEAVHLIGSLCGLEWPESHYLQQYTDAASRLRRAFELTRELLSRVARLRPVILCFDDLQWADKSSLELLEYLFQPDRARPALMVLAGARDDFMRQSGPGLALINLAMNIPLRAIPFTPQTVAQAYPDLRSWSPALLTELAQRCDGNPYFLEEMVKGLLKSAAETPALSADEQLAYLRDNPPESLRAMLQARLDDLPREARSVALLASVVGRVFWVGAVVAAARTSSVAGTGLLASASSAVVERLIQDSLRHLVRAELAFPRASSQFSAEQEYIFKHSLLREVAYSLIPNKYLSQYHLAVARWLLGHPELDFVIMSAEHFELAGAYREASNQYEHAARLSRGRGGTNEALAMTNKAIELKKKAKEAGE